MAVAETTVAPLPVEHPGAVGPIGRLGRWAADHFRLVSITWVAIALALAIFAPKVETALSGAGWQANGSRVGAGSRADPAELRRALQLGAARRHPFADAASDGSPPSARLSRRRKGSSVRIRAISTVVPPSPGSSISRDGHTALVVGGAKRRSDGDGRCRRLAEGQAARLSTSADLGQPHRRLRHVVGLQRRQPEGDDEVRAVLVAGDAGDPSPRLRLARRRRACRCC